MAVKEKTLESSEEFEWNVENEIQLFFAMNGHKPVGVNKYFHMVCIWEKFRAATHKDISLKPIWDHLESMYDLMALDDMEDLPFPSNEVDFNLPETEFQDLVKRQTTLAVAAAGATRKKEEAESNRAKEQKEKIKDAAKKDKEVKDTPKKDLPPRGEQKVAKEVDKKKEEVKKVAKEPEVKKDKQRGSSKSRPKGKDEADEASPTSTIKKERKDSGSSREELKRIPKRPTRQSIDNTSKASTSPRDTPPLKRRRI